MVAVGRQGQDALHVLHQRRRAGGDLACGLGARGGRKLRAVRRGLAGLVQPKGGLQAQDADHRLVQPVRRDPTIGQRGLDPGDVGLGFVGEEDDVAARRHHFGQHRCRGAPRRRRPAIGVASETMTPLKPSSPRRSVWFRRRRDRGWAVGLEPRVGVVRQHIGREGDMGRHDRHHAGFDRRAVEGAVGGVPVVHATAG